MDPLTAAYFGLAAFQLYSGYTQAEMIGRQARLQQKINMMNAKYVELDAYEAEKMGYTQQARYQSVIDQTVGQQRAGYASQGVDVSSGTALAMQSDAKVTGMLNLLDIQSEARKRALGLKFEASNIRLGTGMMIAQAAANQTAARVQGIAGAAETGLAGYSRLGKTKSEYGETPTRTGSDGWTEVDYSSAGIKYKSPYFGTFD